MGEAEDVLERAQRELDRLVLGRRRAHAAHELVQPLEDVSVGLAVGGDVDVAQTHAGDDAMDIGAAQARGLLGAGPCGDGLEVALERVEDWALGLGVQEAQVEEVLLDGVGIDHEHLRGWVLVEVGRGLRKNWRDRATRSPSTYCTSDMYVMFGVPSAPQVANAEGITPCRQLRIAVSGTCAPVTGGLLPPGQGSGRRARGR